MIKTSPTLTTPQGVTQATQARQTPQLTLKVDTTLNTDIKLDTKGGRPPASESTITASSLASTSHPLPILTSESRRVFDQSRALYVRITVVHQASGSRASFAMPKKMLAVLDELQARSEDLRTAAHRLIAAVEADTRRQAMEAAEPDKVVMLGLHHQQQVQADHGDSAIPLDILTQELQHLDNMLERLEYEWSRSDVCAYWYGPCTNPAFMDVEMDSDMGMTLTEMSAWEGDSLCSTLVVSDAPHSYSSFRSNSRGSAPWSPITKHPLTGAGQDPIPCPDANGPGNTHPTGAAGAGGNGPTKRRNSHLSPLTPIDMPAPYRPPIRHRSGTIVSHFKATPGSSKLNPSAPMQSRGPNGQRSNEGYFPALAFREWEDDELDVGRSRDVILGCLM